ncbi:MAG: hypothetical protein HYX48_06845 [Chlamydiales bacterium]|nr:hypothetical protein [Chlamydiales bacterium]
MKKIISFALLFCCLIANARADESVDSYPWKGLVEDEATSGVVTLSDLKLNGHSRVAIVKPGEEVQAEVQCSFDRAHCSKFSLYRIVIGIEGTGPLTSIYNSFCLLTERSHEKFVFKAPEKTGLYQLRFRVANTLYKKDALLTWTDKQGEEPGAGTTIGILIVNGS